MPENLDPRPFGNPDGGRADIDEVTQGFVQFRDPLVWKALATQPADLTARLFVGQKGSGKTVYLRRSRDFAVGSNDLIAGDLEICKLATDDVKRLSSFFSKYELREHWSRVWHCAIIRAAASHMINNDFASQYVPAADADRLRLDFVKLLRYPNPFRHPTSIYAEVNDILRHMSRNSLHTYLYDNLWVQLEADLGCLLRQAPPLCLYLDGVDDEFQHAPMHWLEVQMGLFDAIMSLLRSQRFGGRLHVFAAIRDLVYLKVLQSEHAMRNFEEPHIRVLSWNTDAIMRFLSEKVRRLDDRYFARGGDKTVRTWLGVDTFENSRRKVHEPIEQYLLRHTRLLPRDVVILGNILCQELQGVSQDNGPAARTTVIARAVNKTARKLGGEQIAICAHQLVVDQEEPGTSRRDPAFRGADEYARNTADFLREFIRSFKSDRVKGDFLRKQDERAKEAFGDHTDVLTILWLNDVLGYVDPSYKDGRVIFYSTDVAVDFKLPRDRERYAFHSSMIDVAGLVPSGKPVLHAR